MYKALTSFCNEELDIAQGDILASDFTTAANIADLLAAGYIEVYEEANIYKYKGTVLTYNDLPDTGLSVGDVYNVEDSGNNYAWTGTEWDSLGGSVDLSNYQTKIDSSHKLSSDLVDDTNNTNKFVTTSEKSTWNGKYDKPSGGIPSTDLASAVQTSLGKADTALQSYTEQYTGTITSVKMNGSTISSSGEADLGTVITSHQDISGKQDVMQFSTMPTADSTTVGKIIQYTGTTDSTYTNGYFYVCVSETETVDEEEVTTYSWSNLNVEESDDVILFNDETPSSSTSTTQINTEYNRNQVKKLVEAITNGKYPVVLLKNTNALGSYGQGSIIPMSYSIQGDASSSFSFFFITNTYNFSSGYIYNSYYVQYGVNNAISFSATYTFSNNSVSLGSRAKQGTYYIPTVAEQQFMPISGYYFVNALGLSSYVSSQTYQIGDYVYKFRTAGATGLNNIVIYKCNTANTTGTWNDSKWDEKTYMEYLSDTLVGGALNGSY